LDEIRGTCTVKILIVDDHQMLRDGLRLILERERERPEILEAASAGEGLRTAADHPDLELVMLDINLPDQDGRDALPIFAERYPTLPIIMLTASESRHHMNRCFELGASGYIPKSASGEVMRAAIRLVLAGGVYIPPSMGMARLGSSRPGGQSTVNSSLDMLTERQSEVMRQLMNGCSNKQIANHLSVSEATIKVHVSAILKTLGLKTRLEAALLAQKEDFFSA
jgi:two-component system nitrate/nitrite response regulator NarL